MNLNFRFLRFWFLRSSKCSECLQATWNSPGQPVELTQTLATGKIAPHSQYFYVVTNVSHYYAEIIDCL